MADGGARIQVRRVCDAHAHRPVASEIAPPKQGTTA
jgi:hypothetical protein